MNCPHCNRLFYSSPLQYPIHCSCEAIIQENGSFVLGNTICVYRGGQSGTVECPTCAVRTRDIPVYVCGLHKECVATTAIKGGRGRGIRSCTTCEDYARPDRNPDAPLPILDNEVAKAESRQPTMKWSYGVTTVPSRFKLLEQTLESLAKAGFDKPRLFIDGCDPRQVPNKLLRYDFVCRYPTIRAYANWLLSALELYLRNPHADRYAIFQDDILCYKNLRDFLERSKYPEHSYLNLYTFPQNVKPKKGWYPSNQRGLGALGLIFSNEAMRLLLTQPGMIYRADDAKRGHKFIDGGVVTAMKNASWIEYVHNPSLVQHTGDRSSIGNGPHAKANTWLGEETDAMSLLS